MPEAETEVRFEGLLARLEELVDKLESEELDLESSLSAFEDGVRLARECHRRLDAAERKIQMLRSETDAAEPAPARDPASESSDVDP